MGKFENNPKVTIIIPTRNREEVLEACLQSLIRQEYSNLNEIIVVDDGLSRSTEEMVGRLAESCISDCSIDLLYTSQPSLGANAARNKGIATATGEVLVFVDDDITAPSGWLNKLIQGLLKSKCLVGTGSVKVPLKGPVLGKHRGEVQSFIGEILAPPRAFDGRIVPVAGNMAAFRNVFDQALFDEGLRPPVEEIDWLIRTGVETAFIPEAVVHHHKIGDDVRLRRILPIAWNRGSERGWWKRKRLKQPGSKRVLSVLSSLKNALRSLGHALRYRCWGGVIVGVSELAHVLALIGLINWKSRRPKSWR